MTTIRYTHGFYYLAAHGGYKSMNKEQAQATIQGARFLESFKENKQPEYIDYSWQSVNDRPLDIEKIEEKEFEQWAKK